MRRYPIPLLLVLVGWSSLGAGAEPQPAKSPRPENRLRSDSLKKLIGTWTDKDNSCLIGISRTTRGIRIRECCGANPTAGTEYFGKYSNEKLIATGNAQDFYKFEFPQFEIVDTGELLHRCGACGPDKLKRTTKQMPNIPYTPPVNND